MTYEAFDDPDGCGHQFAFWTEGILHDTPMLLWCAETFGARPHLPQGSRWFHLAHTIWFRDANDALQFRLRWC